MEVKNIDIPLILRVILNKNEKNIKCKIYYF